MVNHTFHIILQQKVYIHNLIKEYPMKDLVNEGRHLQDSFKDKLKEAPMDVAPTAPSKADMHYKINHPVLTVLKIEQDKRGFSSNRGTTYMTIIFGFKQPMKMDMPDIEQLKKDAWRIASDLCEKWNNYNTDHFPSKPQEVGNTIVVPVRVEHWTGD
jgi:hypothetical protein